MTTITVHRVKKANDLLHVYPREQEPQPVFVRLDCQTGWLDATYDPEVGSPRAVPAEVWHGHTRRYYIPILRADCANELLEQIAPLAQRVVDGYRSEWNGNSHVAVFDDDAQAAEGEIEAAIEAAIEDWGEYGQLHWAHARDWLCGAESEVKAMLAEKGIDATMEELDGQGMLEDEPVLIGLREYLENLAAEG